MVIKDIVAEKAVTGGEERDASYDRIQESANVGSYFIEKMDLAGLK